MSILRGIIYKLSGTNAKIRYWRSNMHKIAQSIRDMETPFKHILHHYDKLRKGHLSIEKFLAKLKSLSQFSEHFQNSIGFHQKANNFYTHEVQKLGDEHLLNQWRSLLAALNAVNIYFEEINKHFDKLHVFLDANDHEHIKDLLLENRRLFLEALKKFNENYKE